MEKQFLIDLGLSADVAKKVLVEHGKDIQSANAKTAAAEQERDGLKSQLTDHDEQLEKLKKVTGNSDELKSQIKALQEQNKADAEQWQQKLAEQDKGFKIDTALRDAHARNPKAVKALLDLNKVSVTDKGLDGLTDQLEDIKKSDQYLFEPTKPTTDNSASTTNGVQMTLGGNPSGASDGKPNLIQKIASRMEDSK